MKCQYFTFASKNHNVFNVSKASIHKNGLKKYWAKLFSKTSKLLQVWIPVASRVFFERFSFTFIDQL